MVTPLLPDSEQERILYANLNLIRRTLSRAYGSRWSLFVTSIYSSVVLCISLLIVLCSLWATSWQYGTTVVSILFWLVGYFIRFINIHIKINFVSRKRHI